MTVFENSPIISVMPEKELQLSEPRQDRLRPVFEQATKVFKNEFEGIAMDGYRWEFESERDLFEKEKRDMIEQNRGVLMITGDLRDDPLLLPRIYYPSAQRGSDDLRTRILLPERSARLIRMLDTGKIENREATSRLQSEFFLEATRAMLSDNLQGVSLDFDQDLIQFILKGYFSSVVQRGNAYDEPEKAADYIHQIVERLSGSQFDDFALVVAGLQVGIIYQGEPLFTQYYGADDIVQKLIANSMLPKFVRRMDQKYVWFRSDAADVGYDLPQLDDEDVVLVLCKEFGIEKDQKHLISAYLSGDLGVRFLDAVSSESRKKSREERFKARLADDLGKEELAKQLQTAMASREIEEQPDYSTYQDTHQNYETDEEYEEDPEVVRRARFVKGKKPNKAEMFED